jgi:HlyD family secretion protein
MSRALLTVAGIGALVVVLMAANAHRDSKAVNVDWRVVRRPAVPVSVEEPSRGVIVQTITAPAEVLPFRRSDVASQLVGRVVEVLVKDGDVVRKGDVLVRLDALDAQARLKTSTARITRAKAAITHAEAEIERAAREMNRTASLHARGVATAEELANMRSTHAKAQATLSMNQAELIESEGTRLLNVQEFSRTEIRAPIDGVITGRNVEVGEVAIAGTVNLPGAKMMTICDNSRVWIRADVDEADVALVRAGQPARIFLQADPTTPALGVTERLAVQGKKSEEVVSFETRVLVTSNGGRLQPGMSAMVEVEVSRSENALGVPVQAMVHRRRKDLPDTPEVQEWVSKHSRSAGGGSAQDAESQYVRLVFINDNGVARARPIESALCDEHRVEIVSGLKPTERVIVGPFRALDELRDGFPVKEIVAVKSTAGGRS